MIKKFKYHKYKITWFDPTGSTEWTTEKEFNAFTPEECVIEAFVFSKDKKFIKTFASYSTDSEGEFHFGDTNVLPRATIIKMEKIYDRTK